MREGKMRNRLVGVASPYLQQHAGNPVAWWPWGDEAFAEARRRDCLVLVSIGYATCHWCHVMERECFEDEGVAEVMNEEFVCVKVDRQEHPEVDAMYMAFLQATTGSGGWPMNVWVTPEGVAVVAGTYFPRESVGGRVGFVDFCRDLGRVWREDRGRVLASGARILAYLREESRGSVGSGERLELGEIREKFLDECEASWDEEHGGWGGAPKFPRAVVPRALLQLGGRGGYERVAAALRAMRAGGIWDQLGGGFHRYSVDAGWRVPHFEKMLYDQAQMALLAMEAWQVGGEEEFRELGEEVVDYVLRELRDGKTGGFHAGEDADAKDEAGISREGAFWVWESGEIDKILGDARAAALFCCAYGVTAEGNVMPSFDPHGELEGKNVLYRAVGDEELAELFELSREEVRLSLASSREKLLAVRGGRNAPFRDNWQLVSWNAMMVVALARGARIWQREDWGRIAGEILDWIFEVLWVDGKLRKGFCGGVSDGAGGVGDYAWLIAALLEQLGVEENVRNEAWLLALQEGMDREFWSEEWAGYVTRGEVSGKTILEIREDYDGAEPAANHVAGWNLQRLAVFTGDAKWEEKARRMVLGGAKSGEQRPFAQPLWLAVADVLERGVVKVEVGSEMAEELRERLSRGLFSRVLWVAKQGGDEVQVCSLQQCFAPMRTVAEWEEFLTRSGEM